MRRRLPSLLAALAAQTAEHEVVLVDAGSTDDTAAVAEAAGARVVSARGETARSRATSGWPPLAAT